MVRAVISMEGEGGIWVKGLGGTGGWLRNTRVKEGKWEGKREGSWDGK